MIRTLLVDDQQLVRAGLRILCESTSDIEILGEAAGGAEAVRLAESALPDVILMDLRMPGTAGITATERILRTRPAIRVVMQKPGSPTRVHLAVLAVRHDLTAAPNKSRAGGPP